eukprot:6189357-Pleurochrysis_carterae.AAC.2
MPPAHDDWCLRVEQHSEGSRTIIPETLLAQRLCPRKMRRARPDCIFDVSCAYHTEARRQAGRLRRSER